MVETDTDSLYLGISSQTFDELVKPELKAEYEQDKGNWFPRTDTKENMAHDKRTPGLFKVEFEGDGIIALCSKSYFCWSNDKSKFSSKGLTVSQLGDHQWLLIEVSG